EGVQVPPAVGGEGAHQVAALGDRRPQVLGAAHTTGEATGHAHDGDGLTGLVLDLPQPALHRAQIGGGPLEVVAELRLVVVHRSMPLLLPTAPSSDRFAPARRYGVEPSEGSNQGCLGWARQGPKKRCPTYTNH